MASLVTLTLATALADHATDDAGSGYDAGNTKATAMVLPAYGPYHGYLAPRDVDWFRVDEAAAPRCVEVTAMGENNATARLTLDSADRSRSLTGRAAGGSSVLLALAAPSVQASYFDITASPNNPNSGDPARPSHYEFTMSSKGIPVAAMGDALTGADAGNSLDRATPVSAGCVGGNIATVGAIGDMRDVYAVQATAGQAITYGLATSAAPGVLTLTLLDAAGNVVGPALVSGQYASVQVPTTGTFYLSTARASVGTEDVGYLVSVIIGPPDPGNPCRPQC